MRGKGLIDIDGKEVEAWRVIGPAETAPDAPETGTEGVPPLPDNIRTDGNGNIWYDNQTPPEAPEAPAATTPSVEDITARVPKQENGDTDWEALLESNPADFAILFEQQEGVDAAREQLRDLSESIGGKIASEQAKLGKETSLNARMNIKKGITELEARKAQVDGVIRGRYESKTGEPATTETQTSPQQAPPQPLFVDPLAAEIQRGMANLAEGALMGLQENAREKVIGWADNIISGAETYARATNGLSPTFVNALNEALTQRGRADLIEGGPAPQTEKPVEKAPAASDELPPLPDNLQTDGNGKVWYGESTTESEESKDDKGINAELIIFAMEEMAVPAPQLELTPENWITEFGENGVVSTPIGEVKMGENQLAKMFLKKRTGEFGMIKPTLENPDVVLEVNSKEASNNSDRETNLLFIKTFSLNGEKIRHFESVTVSQDKKEVVVSSHIIREKQLLDRLKAGKVVYTATSLDVSGQTPLEYFSQTESGALSADKDNTNTPENQKTGEKTASAIPSDFDGDIIGLAERVVAEKEIADAEKDVDTSPTEGQKKAGNYRKGHVKVRGFDITIEQPKGSVRSGTDENGKKWSRVMNNTYGYIRGTEGKDRDHIDVFIGGNPTSKKVFVVDQVNPNTGEFDEHKVMLGFNDIKEAARAYLSNYEKGWKGLGGILETDVESFRKWAQTEGRRIKPFAKYAASQNNNEVRLQSVPDESLEAVNERFNAELDRFAAGKQKGELHLGKPLAKLQAAGVQAQGITVTPKVLKDHLNRHGLTAEDLKGLAKAIQDPMLVYEWGSRAKSTIIVTDLTVADGRKITVAIKLERNGRKLSVNEVAGVYGKADSRMLDDFKKATPEELRDEKLKWVENEKALDWLGLVPPEGTASLSDPTLNSIAKVIKEFQNPKLPEVRFHAVSPIGFFHTTEKALDGIRQEKGTPAQFKAMLLKNGAKQAELDWMGWDEFADQKTSVTKQQIQEWIDSNRIDVREVEKGEILQKVAYDLEDDEITEEIIDDLNHRIVNYPEYEELRNYGDFVNIYVTETDGKIDIGWENLDEENDTEELLEKLRDKLINEIVEIPDEYGSTKYSEYTLPGGKNYRELLLTFVEGHNRGQRKIKRERDFWQKYLRKLREIGDEYKKEVGKLYAERDGLIKEAKEKYRGKGENAGEELDEIIDKALEKCEEEKEKAYEDQSRKKAKAKEEYEKSQRAQAVNYKSDHWNENNILAHVRFNERTDEHGNRVLFIEEIQSDWAQAAKKKGADAVPDTPFRNTDQWVNLALRRMMRYAAENGFDRVAWTTGDMQADRYDLAKQVDRIVVEAEDGKYTILTAAKGETELKEMAVATKENLSDYIGKELAKKAIDEEGGDFSGNDLRVGGSGMRAFYDKIIPAQASKLGKPFGAKVEHTEVSLKASGKYAAVQSLAVTPEMKKSVMEQGVPLFQTSSGKFAPIAGRKLKKLVNWLLRSGMTKEVLIDEAKMRDYLENYFAKKAGARMQITPEERRIDLLRETPYVDSGERRVDNDYDEDDAEREQRKVYIPSYVNTWTYADNTNPDVERFEDLDRALDDLVRQGNITEVDKGYSPVKETRLSMREAWIDRNGDVVEEGREMSYDDFAWQEKDNDFVKRFGEDGGIASNVFDEYGYAPADQALLDEVYDRVAEGLVKEGEIDGRKVSFSTSNYGKYRIISINDEDGREIDRIQLRIADHSYNPANNDTDARSGKFISVVIADRDPTYYKFEGKYNLHFDSSDSYEDVMRGLNKRILDIVERNVRFSTAAARFMTFYARRGTDMQAETPEDAEKEAENLRHIFEYIRPMMTRRGEVYGFVTDEGVIYLDPKRMNANTPFHEFGHLWNTFIKKNNRVLWERGKKLIMNSPYWDRVSSDPNYAGLSEDDRVDEALAMAIGDKGEAVMQSRDILSLAKLKTWLNEVWEWLGSKLGIRGLTPSQIENLTLEQFTSGAVADLTSGKNLTENSTDEGDNVVSLREIINEKGEVNYDRLGEAADAIESGTARLDRLSLAEEQGRREGGRRNVEASLILGGDRQTDSKEYDRKETWEIAERQEKILKKYAKKQKIWLSEDTISGESLRRLPTGQESRVYLDKDGKHVTKITHYLVMSESPEEFLDNRISLHNYIFRGSHTGYELLGFTETEDGFSFVVRQPFVQGTMLFNEDSDVLTPEQKELLDAEMQRRGFKNDKGTTYYSDDYVIDDIHGGNVMIDAAGNFHFIDTVPQLNTPEEGFGGTREYGSGELIAVAPQEGNTGNVSLEGLEAIDTPRHNFRNIREAREWAKEHIAGTYHNRNADEDINVSKTAIDKYLSQKAVEKSVSKDAHLSALKQIPALIETAILRNRKQDRDNNTNIEEIQRLYGAINYEGKAYPVKITVKIIKNEGNNAYSYEVMQIESPEEDAGDRIQNTADFLPYTSGLTAENKSQGKDTNNSEINKEDGENIRFQSVSSVAPDITEERRKEIDDKLKSLVFKIREGWEDRYLAVKEFLDILREHGVEVKDYNDFYSQSTHLTGRVDAKKLFYENEYQKPLNEAIRKLKEKGFSLRDIDSYAILKHGLERNAWMRSDAVRRFSKKHQGEADFTERLAAFEKRLREDWSGVKQYSLLTRTLSEAN